MPRNPATARLRALRPAPEDTTHILPSIYTDVERVSKFSVAVSPVSVHDFTVSGRLLRRRFPTQSERVELVNLFHLARTAGKDTRHSRLSWAADQFVKNHPSRTSVSAYKSVDEATKQG